MRARDRTQINIEATPVLRGGVYEPEVMAVSGTVKDEFGFAETQVLSFGELHAGKIMAALDRQHRVHIEGKSVTGYSRLQPGQTELFEALKLPIPHVENVVECHFYVSYANAISDLRR